MLLIGILAGIVAGLAAGGRPSNLLSVRVRFGALILVAEVILYAAFILHIVLALSSHYSNREARGRTYAMKQTKRGDRTVNLFGWTPDTTMFVTGAIVLAFLIVHLNDFSWELIGESSGEREPYEKAVHLMGNSLRGVIYLVGCLVLGVHVAHGFQSAFQSLGLNHPQYTPLIKKASIAFAFGARAGWLIICCREAASRKRMVDLGRAGALPCAGA